MAEALPLELGPSLSALGHKNLSNIMQFLTLKEVLSLSLLCRSLRDAANWYLKSCRRLDFTNGHALFLPASLDDTRLHILMSRCEKLEKIDGFHPRELGFRCRRQNVSVSALTVTGVINALKLCPYLISIESSNAELLEAILVHFPGIHMVSCGRGLCPQPARLKSKCLRLTCAHLTSLHLCDVAVSESFLLPEVTSLELVCVSIRSAYPFDMFEAPKLKSFRMNHVPRDYWLMVLFQGLSKCKHLTDLQLDGRLTVKISFNWLALRVMHFLGNEDFTKLENLTFNQIEISNIDICKLMMLSRHHLKILKLYIVYDKLFEIPADQSVKEFSNLQELHLGSVNDLPCSEETRHNQVPVVRHRPTSRRRLPRHTSRCWLPLTDLGVRRLRELFPNLQRLNISNCHQLQSPHTWIPGDDSGFCLLACLSLRSCNGIQAHSLARFIHELPSIKDVILEDLFQENPSKSMEESFLAIVDSETEKTECTSGDADLDKGGPLTLRDNIDDCGPSFSVRSDTLEHFSLKNCGLKDITINDCPNLHRVNITKCLKLKNIYLEVCPSLVDIEIDVCPEFHVSALVKSILTLVVDQPLRSVIIKSCNDKFAKVLEEEILNVETNHNIYLMKDYSTFSQSGTIERLKERVMLLYKLNRMLLEKGDVPLKTIRGKKEYKLEGNLPNGRYELLTNDPLMRPLLLKEDLSVHLGTSCIYGEKIQGNNYTTVEPPEEYMYFSRLQTAVETRARIYSRPNHTCIYLHIVTKV